MIKVFPTNFIYVIRWYPNKYIVLTDAMVSIWPYTHTPNTHFVNKLGTCSCCHMSKHIYSDSEAMDREWTTGVLANTPL